jgi:hypothetical protein
MRIRPSPSGGVGRTRERLRRATAERASQIAASAALPTPTHEQIAARAYEFFLGRGAADGDDIQDWLSAEQELLIQMMAFAKNADAISDADQPSGI